MAAFDHHQLRTFMAEHLCPRASVTSTVCGVLMEECTTIQSDEKWLVNRKKQERMKALIERMTAASNQQDALMSQWCVIMVELGEQIPENYKERIVKGEIDAKFNLWLASRSIVADFARLAELRAQYEGK